LKPELDPVANTCRRRRLSCPFDEGRVDVESDAAGAVLAGRGDDDASVAAAEVVNDVGRHHGGQTEHPLDNVIRGREVGCQALLVSAAERRQPCSHGYGQTPHLRTILSSNPPSTYGPAARLEKG
jgi:hypothetical protein